jgi:hypothetical protein
MQYQATSPEGYIAQLPDARKVAVTRLRQSVLENLPHGFVEEMNYGMIGYVVPPYQIPGRLSLRYQDAPAFYEHRIAKKSHCTLPHGHLYQAGFDGLVAK